MTIIFISESFSDTVPYGSLYHVSNRQDWFMAQWFIKFYTPELHSRMCSFDSFKVIANSVIHK